MFKLFFPNKTVFTDHRKQYLLRNLDNNINLISCLFVILNLSNLKKENHII